MATTESINVPVGFLGDVLKRKETNRLFCSKLSSSRKLVKVTPEADGLIWGLFR